jgi:hypothetical protein
MAANQKRIESCKKVGGEKKRTGHKREDVFGERWCDPSATTYKAEADKTITNEEMLSVLRTTLGVSSGRCSIKSGKNLQFTLGKIPEITDVEDKVSAISVRAVWEKYLGKSESQSPADVLVYRDDDRWIFFNMRNVIDFIVSSCEWRMTDTGRMKGDFKDGSKKGVRQYLTYEYRQTHKSYFLGANGNRGKAFIEILQEKLPYYQEVDR